MSFLLRALNDATGGLLQRVGLVHQEEERGYEVYRERRLSSDGERLRAVQETTGRGVWVVQETIETVRRPADLYEATECGDLQAVTEYLQDGQDILFRNPSTSKTPLEIAREKWQVQGREFGTSNFRAVLDRLTQAIDEKTREAALRGDESRVRDFHQNGADIHQRDLNECDLGLPEHTARAHGDHVETLKYLMENDVENKELLKHGNGEGKRLHVIAQEAGNIKCTKYLCGLLQHELFTAANQGNSHEYDMIRKLLGIPSDFTDQNELIHNCLIQAIMGRKLKMIKHIVKNGHINLAHKDKESHTALDVAASIDPSEPEIENYLQHVYENQNLCSMIKNQGADLDVEMLRRCFLQGANVNYQDHDGNTPLILAVRYGCSVEVVKLLISSYSAKLELVNQQGTGALKAAVLSRNHAVIKCLLSHKEQRPSYLRTMMQFATEHNRPEAARLLQNEVSKYVWTAIDKKDTKRIKELNDLNADLNVEYSPTDPDENDREGWRPLHGAVGYGDDKMLKMLHQLGSDLEGKDAHGNTPLHLTCHKSTLETLTLLHTFGATINVQNNTGFTPLMTATARESVPMVRFLLLHGADETVMNQAGDTAHTIAGRIPNDDHQISSILENLEYDKVCGKYNEEGNKDPDIHTETDYPSRAEVSADERPWLMAHIKRCDSCLHGGSQQQYNDSLRSDKCLEDEELRRAVKRGTREDVQKCHRSGGTINQCNQEDPHGLVGLAARSQDKPDIIEYLTQVDQANMHALCIEDSDGQTILTLAKAKGHKNVVKYMIGHYSLQINQAVTNNDLHMCKKFKRLGGLVEISGSREPNLAIALSKRNDNIAKWLVESGSDPNWRDRNGTSLVEVASRYNMIDMEKFLKSKIKNQHLMSAIRAVDLKGVKRLHAEGADLTAANCFGDTPVSLAVRTGNLRLVHYLLSRGASVIHNNTEKPTMIQQAQKLGNGDMVEYLKHMVHLRFEDSLKAGDTDTLAKLLKISGASLKEAKFCKGEETAATLAVKYHDCQALRILYNRNIPVSHPNRNGDYPLTLAAANGDFPAVKFLIEDCNVNKNVVNGEDKTVAEVARNAGYDLVASYVETGKKPAKTKEAKTDKPSHTLEQLLAAVKRTKMDVIDDFIKETYQSRSRKLDLCKKMLDVARLLHAIEITRKLDKHLQEMETDNSARKLEGSEDYQRVLDGFLGDLVKQIANVDSVDEFGKSLESVKSKVKGDTDSLSMSMRKDIGSIRQDTKKEKQSLSQKLRDLNTTRSKLDLEMKKIHKHLTDYTDQTKRSEDLAMRTGLANVIESSKQKMNVLGVYQELVTKRQDVLLKSQDVLLGFEQQEHANILFFFKTVINTLDQFFLKWRVFCEESDQDDAENQIFQFKNLKAWKGNDKRDVTLQVCSPEDFMKFYNRAIVTGHLAVRTQENSDTHAALVAEVELQTIVTTTAYKLTLWFANQIRELAVEDRHKLCPAAALAEYCCARIISGFHAKTFSEQKDLGRQLADHVVKWIPLDEEDLHLHGAAGEKYSIGVIESDAAKNKYNLGIVEVSMRLGTQDFERTTPNLILSAGGLVTKHGDVYEHEMHTKRTTSGQPKYAYGCYNGTDEVAKFRKMKQVRTALRPDRKYFVDDDRSMSAAIQREFTEFLEIMDELSATTKESAKDWYYRAHIKIKELQVSVTFLTDRMKIMEQEAARHREIITEQENRLLALEEKYQDADRRIAEQQRKHEKLQEDICGDRVHMANSWLENVEQLKAMYEERKSDRDRLTSEMDKINARLQNLECPPQSTKKSEEQSTPQDEK